MKRMMILLALIMSLTASAQELMIKGRFKGDELLDEQPYTYWKSRHVYIMEYDDGRAFICMINPSHVFTNDGYARIGLYSASGKLILATERWSEDLDDSYTSAYLVRGYTNDTTSVYGRKPYDREVGEKAVREITKQNIVEAKNVLKFLKETNGYIRIVAYTYNGMFDVKARLKK